MSDTYKHNDPNMTPLTPEQENRLPDLDADWARVSETLATFLGAPLTADQLPGGPPTPAGFVTPAAIRLALRRTLGPGEGDSTMLIKRVERLFRMLLVNGLPIDVACCSRPPYSAYRSRG
jgi:hypothetical protein